MTMTTNHDETVRPPYLDAYNVLRLLGVPVFVNDDHAELGNFGITAEHENSERWVRYYNAPGNWYFGVSPELDGLLEQFGLFAEWINPGCLGVYKA